MEEVIVLTSTEYVWGQEPLHSRPPDRLFVGDKI